MSSGGRVQRGGHRKKGAETVTEGTQAMGQQVPRSVLGKRTLKGGN